MPILAIFTGDITKDQYEMLRKEVHWEDNLPSGAIFHAAAFDDSGGVHIADVWESPELLNDFVGKRLLPVLQKFGFNPPNVEVYPAHNINAYSAISKYILKG